jgi:hypothetical protein
LMLDLSEPAATTAGAPTLEGALLGVVMVGSSGLVRR